MSSKNPLLMIIILLIGCDNVDNQETNIPDAIGQLENLTIHNPVTQPADTVELIKETVFESDEEVCWQLLKMHEEFS